MSPVYSLDTPFSRESVKGLKAGDRVLVNGVIYTARDTAHRRFMAAIAAGQRLPFELSGAVIYYAGPTPAPPGRPIGSIGPTTAGRMDAYTPELLKRGLAAMIGKGLRSQEVRLACVEHQAVYLAATSTAALLAGCVEEAEVIAYEDLGPEAVRRLVVRDFPATVIIDTRGDDYYKLGRQTYATTRSTDD